MSAKELCKQAWRRVVRLGTNVNRAFGGSARDLTVAALVFDVI
jgi:hypothetical protein